MGDGPSRSDARGNHPRLQFLNELQVVGADDEGGIPELFHVRDFERDPSSFPSIKKAIFRISGKSLLGSRWGAVIGKRGRFTFTGRA